MDNDQVAWDGYTTRSSRSHIEMHIGGVVRSSKFVPTGGGHVVASQRHMASAGLEGWVAWQEGAAPLW
jgi:hypothetical protein